MNIKTSFFSPALVKIMICLSTKGPVLLMTFLRIFCCDADSKVIENSEQTCFFFLGTSRKVCERYEIVKKKIDFFGASNGGSFFLII
jgi:hypothetical protein